MNKKIGVLGGGQLGRMMGLEAPQLGIELHFLDKDSTYPAGQVSSNFHEGDFTNAEDVFEFGKEMDAVTIEIENVSVEGLKKLENWGIKVFPQSHVIKLIKDKGLQKEFYQNYKIATSAFTLFATKEDIHSAIAENKIKLPFVQKARTEGYDGKGVQLIRSIADLEKIWDTPSVIEDLVDIKKEIAVIITRTVDGSMEIYPVVEMDFDEKANLLDMLVCPARIPDEINEKAIKMAKRIAEKLSIIGILAVEMFWTNDDEVIVNEVAPRTHNSGHHTINNNYTSQFQQQLRCVAELPLGSVEMISPAVMVNVLGVEDVTGAVTYEGISEILSKEKVYPHIYGKAITKPYRKMGHVTVLADNLELAIENATFVKNNLKATSYESN